VASTKRAAAAAQVGKRGVAGQTWTMTIGARCLRVLGVVVIAGAVAPMARTASAAPRAPARLAVTGGEIDVVFGEGDFDVDRAALIAWVTAGASATVAYYGRFPVAHYRLLIVPIAGEAGVQSGTTWAEGGARTRIFVGEHTTAAQLARDWVMTHEMIHTAFPDLPRAHSWIEEGIATYAEPLARSWTGHAPAAKVWLDLMRGVPHGLPAAGDRGLDHTHTWGRTYWGGALFCLLADVEIRERTHGQRGLIDALRGILAAGGNDQAAWSIDRAFREGDQAVGVPVLEPLYRRMKDRPVATDLPALWRALGVSVAHGELVLDEDAPKAALRRAITAPPTGVSP
jgi:hypothetical protein